MLMDNPSALERFLWEESLEARTITVEIHPQTVHKKRPVIAKALVPLKLTYVYGKLESGAWRVRVPRFGWSFVIEELSIAREVLQNALTTALLGEKPKGLYDFRHEGAEYVHSWDPGGLQRERRRGAGEDRPPEVLEQISEELTSRALGGRQPALVYDAESMRSWLDYAKRQPPQSLLLVGGPGSGKTSQVLRLARLIAELRREDKKARLPKIWRTSAERIVAGMVYLGMWQERCLKIVDALSYENDYLYVDRLTSILAPQPDGSSIGDLLLPAATERGDLPHRRVHRGRAGALPAALPGVAAALPHRPHRAAPGLAGAGAHAALPGGEAQPREHPCPRACGSSWGTWRCSSATACSRARPSASSTGWSSRASAARPGRSTRATSPRPTRATRDCRSSSSVMRFPPSRRRSRGSCGRASSARTAPASWPAGVLARFKAGLNDPEKPVGTLLFVGPTGVGKTELSKQLARTLFGNEDRMIRLDMSEYMLPGSAQRLMEVGPGITSLAERVRQQPMSLVLFDEIEKAHPEVFDLLLGILGEGRLTDSLGRLVDFRMAVVCMTSNLGVEQSEPAGFGAERGAEDFLRAIRQAFRPELFNRIDHVIPFRRLSEADVLRIVDLELEKAASRAGLLRRRLRLVVEPDARAWLARHGYDPKLGARPLKRLIEAKVMAPIAVRLSAEAGLEGAMLPVVVAGTEAERMLRPEYRAVATVLGG